MSTFEDITIPLEPDCYYHIYNRGNNSEKIFYNNENYNYFLKKIAIYMSGYFHFYAYCLLPNHFHLLIRVKNENEILRQAVTDFPNGIRGSKDFQNLEDIPNLQDLEYLSSDLKTKNLPEKIVSEKFRRFFISYAKSINKQESRSGSLFTKNFRRKKINNDGYFRGLVWYIHNNSVKHKVFANYKTYRWSSYNRILMDKPSKLNKNEIFEWFDDRNNFIEFHQIKNIDWGRLNSLIIEKE